MASELYAGAPKISVVLPCYNAEAYIEQAINSIQQQTFHDFELIVLDDGSTDNSLTVIQRLAAADTRIKVVTRENRGLVATLNEGIVLALGQYIARMDADDISLPQRLQKQWDYMEAHADVLLCGTAAEAFVDQNVTALHILPPEKNQDIRALMLFQNCFVHPSVMIRRASLLDEAVCYRQCQAEDYDLWTRICAKGSVYNIPELLLKYRLHDKQLTQTKTDAIQGNAYDISQKLVEDTLGLCLSTEEGTAYRKLASSGVITADDNVLIKLSAKMMRANARIGYCDPKSLEGIIVDRIIACVRRSAFNASLVSLFRLLPILGARRLFRIYRKNLRMKRTYTAKKLQNVELNK